jgi:adenylylsulfate kinase
MSWVIWITGLPGSGKSTIAHELHKKVPDATLLNIDELRRVITPQPTYADTERDYVYRALVFTAKTLHELGHSVIIDATGNRKSWRELARKYVPVFIEVYLSCPLELCMEREKIRANTHAAPREIYEKGKQGWPVPGLKSPYEEPERPDVVIDTEKESPHEAVDKIMKKLQELTHG